MNDLGVVYNGKVQYFLNSALIKRQCVTDEEVQKIKQLHAQKLEFFDKMTLEESTGILQAYAQVIEQIEFELQKQWHFTQDVNYHEWYLVPKCTCPKMDNQQMRGTSYKVINNQCPIHKTI